MIKPLRPFPPAHSAFGWPGLLWAVHSSANAAHIKQARIANTAFMMPFV
jgi:hypothetical protein